MKTFRSTFFSLLVLILGASLISSCSKDNESDTSVGENNKVSAYLKSFYSTNFQLGKSVETKPKSNSSSLYRTTEVEDFVITEVFVGNDSRARGYIISDKTTNDFLYFLDVDRVDFKLTSVSIVTNQSKVFNDIDELDKYTSTDELDYIKIAEDFVSGNSTIEANRFWGWGPAHPSGNCVDGRDYWVKDYYVFWISVAQAPEPGASGNLWSPCGEYVNP